jgi:hypothetical protein
MWKVRLAELDYGRARGNSLVPPTKKSTTIDTSTSSTLITCQTSKECCEIGSFEYDRKF